MARWQVSDVPELKDCDAATRRRRWLAAVTSSRTFASDASILLFCIAAGTFVFAMSSLFPVLESGWRRYALLFFTYALAYNSYARIVLRPRARKWLSEHSPEMAVSDIGR